MDWYPLINSLRIAAVSCAVVFFLGILCAWYAAGLPRAAKGVLDTILTLPMVLPPTVCGYFLLLLFGVKRPLGAFLARFGVRFVMTWYGGVLAASAVAFPLMYRTVQRLHFLAYPYAGLPAGDFGRCGAGFCARFRGVWGDQYARWLYPG